MESLMVFILKLGRRVGHEALGAEVSRSVEVGGNLTDSIKGVLYIGISPVILEFLAKEINNVLFLIYKEE
jgi:hypothetical protein